MYMMKDGEGALNEKKGIQLYSEVETVIIQLLKAPKDREPKLVTSALVTNFVVHQAWDLSY